MIAYHAIRRVVLVLRSVQTALLWASFLAADYADAAGTRAKAAAKASLDKAIDARYEQVTRLRRAVEAAEERFYEAADSAADFDADATKRMSLIEQEVL